MMRSMLNRVIPQTLALAALVVLSCAAALAQDPGMAPTARTDGQIEMDVVHALDGSKALKSDLITAATIQGEVTLAGTVSSESSRELAEVIVSRVPGVNSIHNNLKVGNPQDAANTGGGSAGQPWDNQPDDVPQPAPSANDGPMPVPSQQDQAQTVPPAMPRRPQYRPVQPPVYETPKGPVTVPEGTLIQVRTNEPVGSRGAKQGTELEFTVIHDVAIGGVLAIPRGATVHGVVTLVKQAGELTGTPELALTLTSLDLGGQSYTLETDQFKVRGPGKGESTAGHVIGGAVIGAIIGGAIGRGPGAAIGAAVGGGAGVAASAASGGPGAWIPAEARVDFHVVVPVSVVPVNREEAARLAQGLYQGGPTLYRRGPGPYYGEPYYATYPYGYPPPVYYRPYIFGGGFYYWR